MIDEWRIDGSSTVYRDIGDIEERADATVADLTAGAASAPAYRPDHATFFLAAREVVAASIQFEIDGIGKSNGRDPDRDMIAAQRALSAAAGEIGYLPASGNRDLIIRDIGRLASDFTAAKSVLNGSTAAVTRARVPNATGDTDTISGTLNSIQSALKDSIASLRKETDTHGGFVVQSIEAANHTLADVAAALEFVKANPNLDALTVSTPSGVSQMAEVSPSAYVRNRLNDFGLSIRERRIPQAVTEPQVGLYPNVSQSLFYLATALDVALHEFLNHPDFQTEMDKYDNTIIADIARGMISDVISAIDYVDGPFAEHPGVCQNTTLGHLAVAQRSLKDAIASVQKDPVANQADRQKKRLRTFRKR